MTSFADMLAVGGKTNSLGRTDEVIELVLGDESRLNELFQCLYDDDAWVRMRAADGLEKICRAHPDWLEPYIARLIQDFTSHTQPSIQWHLAQVFAQAELTSGQKTRVITWLTELLSSADIDWIVSANSMDTLVRFTRDGSVAQADLVRLITIQQQHHSPAVVKRATKFLAEFST